MASSQLVLHCGARAVPREELDRIAAPPPTNTWFPIRHAEVVDTVVAEHDPRHTAPTRPERSRQWRTRPPSRRASILTGSGRSPGY